MYQQDTINKLYDDIIKQTLKFDENIKSKTQVEEEIKKLNTHMKAERNFWTPFYSKLKELFPNDDLFYNTLGYLRKLNSAVHDPQNYLQLNDMMTETDIANTRPIVDAALIFIESINNIKK